jgi:hypothetical protein
MTASTDPIIRTAARWFWWIAGLSLINTIMFHSGTNFHFVVGLAMTTMVDEMFASNPPVAMALAGLGAAFYFVIGYLAQRGLTWAFYVGLMVYAVDALLYAMVQDWMPVVIHVVAAVFIFKGVVRVRELASQPAVA